MTTTDVALKCVIDIIDVSANIMRARIVMMVRVAAGSVTFSPSHLLSLTIRTESSCERRCDMRMKVATTCEYLNSVISNITFHVDFHVDFRVDFQCHFPCQSQSQYWFHSISMPILMPIPYQVQPRLIVKPSSNHDQMSMLPLTCLLKNKTKVSVLKLLGRHG